MKLSTRFTQTLGQIQTLIAQYGQSLDIELQQRSVEYIKLFNSFGHMRSALLERMPLPDVKTTSREGGGEATETVIEGGGSPAVAVAAVQPVQVKPQEASLLDLLGDSPAPPAQPQPTQGGNALLDILGGLSVSAPGW
jgi:AP-1 complex subunit gamma-1